MILELPNVLQTVAWDCGPAAVRCVINYFGRRHPGLVERLNATPIDGTDPRTIESYLRNAGFCVQSGDMTVEDLKYHTRSGRPVIVLVVLYGGHYVTVSGVSRGYVHFQDPSDGPRKLKIEEFEAAWHCIERFGATYERFGLAIWERP